MVGRKEKTFTGCLGCTRYSDPYSFFVEHDFRVTSKVSALIARGQSFAVRCLTKYFLSRTIDTNCKNEQFGGILERLGLDKFHLLETKTNFSVCTVEMNDRLKEFLASNSGTADCNFDPINLTKMKTACRLVSENCSAGPCVEINSPAKVNLFLEVLGKRPDGFHELETVICAVNWFDRIRFFRRSDDQIRLLQINPDPIHAAVPTDDQNLIIRALKLQRKIFADKQLSGCDILLYKEVPSEAGLGGASSNAAAALLAGRILWQLNISDADLHALAAELGSDVPFFLRGGTAMCRGRGERVESLPAQGSIPIVIVKPPSGLSTRNVFSRLKPTREVQSAEEFLATYRAGDLAQVGKSLFNRLSETARQLNDQISEISELFSKTNSLGHQMSGSGSSYFGLFHSARAARQAAKQLANQLPLVKIFVGQTLGCARPGISVIV